jgi:hypothetical protein
MKKFNPPLPWVNASAIGAATFCPKSAWFAVQHEKRRKFSACLAGRRRHKRASLVSYRQWLGSWIFQLLRWIMTKRKSRS